MTTMTYGGYSAIVEYDEDAELFHGEVVGLRDVITFQGKSAKELKAAFRDSVEDYLAFCRDRDEMPEKPFSGQFVVRTSPDSHRLAALAARMKGVSLNAWVNEAIETAGAAVTGAAPRSRFAIKRGAATSEFAAPVKGKPADRARRKRA